jgi:hypothetical protein
MLTFAEIKILIAFMALLMSVISSITMLSICYYADKIMPGKEKKPLSNIWVTSKIVAPMSIIMSLVSFYIVLQEPRIIAAIGLILILLFTAIPITATMLSAATIMISRNPAKLEKFKKKKNLLSGILKFNT